MMQRCSSSHVNMVGPCYSCGYFHSSQSNCSSYSMLFHTPYEYDESCYSSSASVDCTLSLGTPSTRFINENEKRCNNFCWDNILQPHPNNNKHTSGSTSIHKTQQPESNNGSDPLSPRRCANCNTTSTPLWRNGPRGPKSLCNACGIRFKKEERRASSAAGNSGGGAAAPVIMETQHMINSSWAHHSSQASQRMPCLSSFNIWG